MDKFLAYILFSNKKDLPIKSLLLLSVKRSSVRGVFCENANLKRKTFILQNAQENTWEGVFFSCKCLGLQPAILLGKGFGASVSPLFMQRFSEQLLCRIRVKGFFQTKLLQKLVKVITFIVKQM